jgi:hypothetical protein
MYARELAEAVKSNYRPTILNEYLTSAPACQCGKGQLPLPPTNAFKNVPDGF